MSTYSDIIDATYTLLIGVSGIGNVYKYLRWAPQYNKLLNIFTYTGGPSNLVNTWMITLANNKPVDATLGDDDFFRAIRRTYMVKLVGVLSLQDINNTERTFLTLCENVMDIVDFKENLGLSADLLYEFGIGPAVMTTYEHRVFGTVLCHYAEIEFPVLVAYQGTYSG